MHQHDDLTAEGVILNRPVEATIDTVLPGWEKEASEPRCVFQGGPVKLDSAVGLVRLPDEDEPPVGTKRLFGTIGLVDLDAPQELVWPAIEDLRIFAGYSGWSAAQLADERARNGWFVVDAEPDDVFDDDPATLWRRVLRRQKGALSWVSTYPEDPDQN